MNGISLLNFWLADALHQLAPCVKPRLAEEFQAHILEMQEAGLSPKEIVERLGDAKKVNRDLRRQYLTAYEQNMLEHRQWTTWRSWLLVTLSAAFITVFAIGHAMSGEPQALSSSVGLTGLALAVAGWNWQQTRSMTAFRRTAWLSHPMVRLVWVVLFILSLRFLVGVDWNFLVNVSPTIALLLLWRVWRGYTLEEKAVHSGWMPGLVSSR